MSSATLGGVTKRVAKRRHERLSQLATWPTIFFVCGLGSGALPPHMFPDRPVSFPFPDSTLRDFQ